MRVFIGALDFGPAGAALGTTLAQTISVAVSLFMILRRKSISLSKGDFHPRRPVVGQILQIGVPEKYYLSQKACLGILRRASLRGKVLPPLLEKALKMQASA